MNINILESKLPVVYLKPGEIHIAEQPTLVVTILGSCVAIIMYNQRLSLGAICHAVLPVCKEEKCNFNCKECFKYVDHSINFMLKNFISYGISPGEIQVKLFGGSNVLNTRRYNGSQTVGEQNIEASIRHLEKNNLKIMVSSTGGIKGRKVYFYTHTGEVWIKTLGKGVSG